VLTKLEILMFIRKQSEKIGGYMVLGSRVTVMMVITQSMKQMY
jgi:hypothetical protein